MRVCCDQTYGRAGCIGYPPGSFHADGPPEGCNPDDNQFHLASNRVVCKGDGDTVPPLQRQRFGMQREPSSYLEVDAAHSAICVSTTGQWNTRMPSPSGRLSSSGKRKWKTRTFSMRRPRDITRREPRQEPRCGETIPSPCASSGNLWELSSFIIHEQSLFSCHPHLHIMLQQRLSRSLQTLARQQQQCFRPQRAQISTTPFISRTYTPAASQRISGRRWYSQAQEAEAKKEESASVQAGEQQKPAEEQPKEDAVQKELEAKKREVIDLTVSL